MESSRALWYEADLDFRPACSQTGLRRKMCCLISWVAGQDVWKTLPRLHWPFRFLVIPICACRCRLRTSFLLAYLCMATCFATFQLELKYCLLGRVFPTFLEKQATAVPVSMTLRKIPRAKDIKSCF